MKRTCFLSLALAAALTAGCRGDNRPVTANPDGAVGTSGVARDADVSSSDKDFVKDVALANMAEVEMGRMAVQSGASASVKKFAQMMIDDHTAAGNQLRTLATQHRIEMPVQMDDDHKDLAGKLAARRGVDFDRDYADAMVDGHQDFVNRLEARIDTEKLAEWKSKHVEPATGTRTEARSEALSIVPEKSDHPVTFTLNQWAAETYPVAFAHLQAAKDLQKGLKRGMTTP